MIARQEGFTDRNDVWAKLAEPLPSSAIAWRQDGKATARDGKFIARFVCYVEAGTVRERLDSVVPGEWDLTMELLPPSPYQSEDEATVNFKAKLQVLGVIREDVGTGKDYKSASTDAFKRAAVRFGIGHELYAFEQNWVQVDGDGKYAKPVEDPQAAYEKRHGSGAKQNGTSVKSGDARATPLASERTTAGPTEAALLSPRQQTAGVPAPSAFDDEPVTCPECSGPMYDNRLTKTKPTQPDYKCKAYRTGCTGVIWPLKEGAKAKPYAQSALAPQRDDFEDFPGALVEQPDDLPF